MKKGLIIVLAIAAVLLIWVFSGYNGLVKLNENADAQWAKVETQYQRRFDLIPNLVNSVKAVLTQEQTVFGELAEARANYAGASTPDQKAAAASQVETSLGRLIAIVESYPQLQSSSNVRDLMTQLEGTENRVSVERTRFNDEIRSYNTAIKTFPTNILALLTGFGERSYFEAASGSENAPQVNF
ncbi:MAG: LemA family protein [Candidatus Zambryskibacteria bacterium RIFCSPLOWO2_02_FULL_51_21]|uniref:LemA family protein n=1 Tax=Candidatus Zambryskibacteria bacterium RIFCSPHIGHO2_02_FULL_43_37 TaxID=1802749 RepID=A0A1G2THS8_9BACT|nr:MAG: LemA family protein [Candidatus Zambryskibacteria bacterium RIFCSPHIGHO2_01_FULL_52_18]OHA96753.1 MAG: LemA family protein [Candidatus Zambryskibacteria bacterium RIFCSPHIGHO2_02_FULL_43_37]OHB07446.1 MAG: LemA family protein [Candidatus Zambryskibacteria bacterium RIFCSPLOWO2_01_FULL_52_12]OHB11109.1 MAG: LemA family protein [Candidatus Zambryskibacteria bacterium RIFCSPLOWO2_02_FULL_51_21]